MLLVRDLLPDARRVLGQCSTEALISRLSDATEILANKSNFDPLLGVVDIATGDGKYVTMPRVVETVLALNISGMPSFPRDRWAEFHLNGLGSDCKDSCDFFWDDKGDYPIFRDPITPVRLVAVVETAADLTHEFWVYGYDHEGNWVYSTDGLGNTVEGYKLSVFFGAVTVPASAPLFSRIVTIRKDETKGYVSLYGYPDGSVSGGLYGYYEPFETLPQYRRIRLSKNACWVRVQFRRKVFRLRTETDLIPLHSKLALMLMLKGLQKLDTDRIEEAEMYERKAVQYLIEEQFSRNPPVTSPLQVNVMNGVVAPDDRLD